MTPTQLILHGDLKADGTLELFERPALPVGPVEILIRPLQTSRPASEDWWQYLQKARAELQSAGHSFRSKEDIDAEITELRSGDERIEEACHHMKGNDCDPGHVS
jgi:hypothetical protein